MAVTTAGFLRKCCPSDVLGATRFEEAPFPAASLLFLDDDHLSPPTPERRGYGADEAAVGSDRRVRLFLGMVF